MTVQSGVPAEEITGWAKDAEWLSEVRDTAKAVSESLEEEDGWYGDLTRARCQVHHQDSNRHRQRRVRLGVLPLTLVHQQLRARALRFYVEIARSLQKIQVKGPPPTIDQYKSGSGNFGMGPSERWDRMAEDVYARPCQNIFDKRMKDTYQWRDWSDAQEYWANLEEPDNEYPPHSHIEHWSERSHWSEIFPCRRNRSGPRTDNDQSWNRREHDDSYDQNASEPEQRYPQDERWA